MVTADLKFNSISRQGDICKLITAKIISIKNKTSKRGSNYLRIILGQGSSKIMAIAYSNLSKAVKERVQQSVGQQLTFSPKTFRAELKKFPSESTCKYTLIFQSFDANACTGKQKTKVKFPPATPSTSRTMVNIPPAIPSRSITTKINLWDSAQPQPRLSDSATCVLKVKNKTVKSHPFTEMVANVTFVKGTIYRYWGCIKCTSSVRTAHSDGKYYCKGRSCKGNSRKRLGVQTERKLCMVLRGLTVKDGCGHVIENIVIFDDECIRLIGKTAAEFVVDEEVTLLSLGLLENEYKMTLQRGKKKRNSNFPSSVVGEELNVIKKNIPLDTTDKVSEEVSADNDEFGKKKRKPKFPILQPFEVHINRQYNAELEKDRSKLDSAYTTNSKPPGMVLLINNRNFKKSPDQNDNEMSREGSEVDVEYLKRLFKELGYILFQNRCIQDVEDRKALKAFLDAYKQTLVERNVDVAIIIIMSHGGSGELRLTGYNQNTNKANLVEDILKPFSDTKFKKFSGKPKIFINAACQDYSLSDYSRALTQSADIQYSDILVCLSSLPGSNSWRHHQNGSLYIHYLVRVIMNAAFNTDFQCILELVKQKISEEIAKAKAYQISIPCHLSYGSVFSKLYLLPQVPQTVDTTGRREGNDSDEEMDINEAMDMDETMYPLEHVKFTGFNY